MGNGCSTVKKTAQLPADAVGVFIPGSKQVQIDPGAMQTEVLRFADDFMGRTSLALDRYADTLNTPEARIEALRWKLALNSGILSIATGPNPIANLLDLVSVSTLVRASLEERAPQAVPPGSLDDWLDTSRALETNAWNLAGTIFTTNQLNQIRAGIEQARAATPSLRASFFARPDQLTSIIRSTREKEQQSGGVFGFIGLDPTAGLDPAVREVTRTRLFAERTLFMAQRMPFLMRWQLDLLTEEILHQDEVSSMLKSVDRISKAAESTSQSVAAMPEHIAEERKAILDALHAQEGKLRELSAQVEQTLGAGDKMSQSLNTTLITFDKLMKRFGVGEPSTTPPDTNSQPFNILDYARTAEQVAIMAKEVDTLLKDTSGTVDSPALDKRIASLNALADRTRADAKSLVNRVFLYAAGLIVLAFGCALAYRKLGRKSPPAKTQG